MQALEGGLPIVNNNAADRRTVAATQVVYNWSWESVTQTAKAKG